MLMLKILVGVFLFVSFYGYLRPTYSPGISLLIIGVGIAGISYLIHIDFLSIKKITTFIKEL